MTQSKQQQPKTSTYGQINKKLRSLFTSTSPQKIKDFLVKHDVYKSTAKWTLKGHMLHGRCRAKTHAGKDENPSMVIDLKKGYSRCYTCGHYERDIGAILAAPTGQSVEAILKKFQTHLGVRLLKNSELKSSQEYQLHQAMRNKLAILLNSILTQAVEVFLDAKDEDAFGESEYFFADPVIRYLQGRDQLLLRHIPNLPLGILPPKLLLVSEASRMGLTSLMTEAILNYLGSYFRTCHLGGMVFFYHDDMQNVSRFRIRMPDAPVAEGEDAAKKVIVAIADTYAHESESNGIGIFGLGQCSHIVDHHKQETKALLMEGEFDAMAVMVGQLENNSLDWAPLCHSGNASAHSLTALEQTPIKQILVVPDCDEGGKANTKAVLEGNLTLNLNVFTWPMTIRLAGTSSTDIADSVKNYSFTKVNNELLAIPQNYCKREMWAQGEVETQCFDLDVEDSDHRDQITSIVTEYAACIGSLQAGINADRVKRWIKNVLGKLGISDDQLSSEHLTIATMEEEPEQQFVSFLLLAFEKHYAFLFKDSKQNTLTLWDRKLRTLLSIPTMTSGSVCTAVQQTMGSLHNWVVNNIPGGVPDFIKNIVVKNPAGKLQPIFVATNAMSPYVYSAISLKFPYLQEEEAFERKGAGVHWLKTSKGDTLFIVNGAHVFMGTFETVNGESRLSWCELEVPIYEKYYFIVTQQEWTSYIHSVQDLDNAPQIPLHEILEGNTQFMDTGWSFVNQATESALMGMWASLITVAKIFPNNFQFLASTEASSGKTALYVKALGGGKGSKINITEHTFYMDHATPAGFRQAVDGSSRTVILDEFDNSKGSNKTREQQNEILNVLRAASTGDGTQFRGTISGKVRKEVFAASCMLAGIDPDIGVANQTRIIPTALKTTPFRTSPEQSILDTLTESGVEKLKQWNTLAMFRHIPAILRSATFLENYLTANPEALELKVMHRFKDSLLKLLSIVHAAYPQDNRWLQLGIDICKSKQAHFDAIKMSSANVDLISALLSQKAIPVDTGTTKNYHALSTLLADSSIIGDPSPINSSGSGVWLHSEISSHPRHYLIIQWRVAKPSLLRVEEFRHSPPPQLKEIAGRHDLVLSDLDALSVASKPTVPVWVTTMGGKNTMSVLDVTETIQSAEQQAKDAYEYSMSPEFHKTLASDAAMDSL